MGDMQQASVHLKQAAELAPTDPRPSRILGLIHKDAGDCDSAVTYYKEALRRDAADPGQLSPSGRQETIKELALCQMQLLRHSEAMATLATADESADVLTLRAKCHEAQGATKDARQCLDRALELDPLHLAALLAKGQLELDANDSAAAVETLERAVEAHPKQSNLHYMLSQAYHRMGNEVAAEKHREEYERLHELDQQYAELNRRANDEPRQPQICFQLGLVAERLDMQEAAVNWYRATLAMDPRHAGARSRLMELSPPTVSDQGDHRDRQP
jgi:tetratricopeptide (TPR) repeat protein